MIKNNIVILLLIIVSISSNAQQKEWHTIVNRLQKEADYFKGKKGYIRLTTQQYNTFTMEDYTIKDTIFYVELKLFDRYEGQDFKKQELKFELKWGFPSIHGVEIDYGSDYYFEGYPDHVFLKLAFSGVHKTIDNPAMNHITIPVRNNQMGSILKGIERYQQKTLAKELKRDRLH